MIGGYVICEAHYGHGIDVWLVGSRIGLKFDSWAEVNEFVSALRAEAEKQFGKDIPNSITSGTQGND